ncbi:MAG: hypothetical protein WCH78_10875 [Bacteroidota bacterium]|jgi:hypothetical protein
MGILDLIYEPHSTGKDELYFHTQRITGQVNMHKFQDKDTQQFVFFSPSLDVTGYGDTEEKALEMVKFSIAELFEHLFVLSSKKRELELQKLGWKPAQFKNKQFSKAFVDGDGVLQNLNAVGNKVEQVALFA